MGIEDTPFDNFTSEVCSQIKCKEIHFDIKKELVSHLEELTEEYLSQGASLEESTRFAISQMGDSEKIGFDLNKIYRKTPEYKTLIITVLFIMIGLFTQFMIEKNMPSDMNMSSYSISHNIIFALIGIIAGITIYIFDYRKLEAYSIHLFILANLFVIFSVYFNEHGNFFFLITTMANIGFISSVLYIISLCGILPKLYYKTYGIIKILALYELCSFMLYQTRSLSNVIIFSFAFILLLIYVGFSKKYLVAFLGISIPLFIKYLMLQQPYRISVLTTFIHFKESRESTGYMNYRLYELLSSSNLFGNGFSKEIFKTTPSLNQEFIYCYIIYTFGWIISIAIFLLITILLVNLFNTSKFIKNSYGKLLFLCISFLFTIEFLLSILMNLNLAPILGISMPFFSHGGASMVINTTLIGLICSIYGRKNISKSLVKTEAFLFSIILSSLKPVKKWFS